MRRTIAETTDDTELVSEGASAGSHDDGIADVVRQTAADVEASVLFVGVNGEGDDGLRTRFGALTAATDYDVYVVRVG